MINLESSIDLIVEANRLQMEYLKEGVHWPLEDCLDAVIDNGIIKTNQSTIDSARMVAQRIDQ